MSYRLRQSNTPLGAGYQQLDHRSPISLLGWRSSLMATSFSRSEEDVRPIRVKYSHGYACVWGRARPNGYGTPTAVRDGAWATATSQSTVKGPGVGHQRVPTTAWRLPRSKEHPKRTTTSSSRRSPPSLARKRPGRSTLQHQSSSWRKLASAYSRHRVCPDWRLLHLFVPAPRRNSANARATVGSSWPSEPTVQGGCTVLSHRLRTRRP